MIVRSRVSSGSIVSDYGLDDREIEVRSPAEEKRIFPLPSVSRPALGPTQPPVQWVPGVLSPGSKAWPGRDADHSSSAEVVNEEELYLLLSPQAPSWRVEGLLYYDSKSSKEFIHFQKCTYALIMHSIITKRHNTPFSRQMMGDFKCTRQQQKSQMIVFFLKNVRNKI
jgi:hypothetical protein